MRGPEGQAGGWCGLAPSNMQYGFSAPSYLLGLSSINFSFRSGGRQQTQRHLVDTSTCTRPSCIDDTRVVRKSHTRYMYMRIDARPRTGERILYASMTQRATATPARAPPLVPRACDHGQTPPHRRFQCQCIFVPLTYFATSAQLATGAPLEQAPDVSHGGALMWTKNYRTLSQ